MPTSIARRILLLAAISGSALSAAAVTTVQGSSVDTDQALEAGRHAYEASDYGRAAQLLQEAAARNPQNAEIQLLLAKTYYETQQRDAAIVSAEKAVALEPQNSTFHEWLGRAYGEKAEHAGMFSGMSLAKKTRKEFDTAVQLDERNFSARQALIEFDCSAPGIVGGGEDKARPNIAKLAEMDVAEGHYAAGNCRRQKKDFAEADAEFAKAIESHPKSINLIYDIGDYAVKHNEPDRLRGRRQRRRAASALRSARKILSRRRFGHDQNATGRSRAPVARISEARAHPKYLSASARRPRVAWPPIRKSGPHASGH